MKKCAKCGRMLPEDRFSPNGQGYLRGSCKECRTVEAKEYKRRKKLGLVRDIRWTEEELEIFRTHYADMTAHELSELLPARSPTSFGHLAMRMGLKKNPAHLDRLMKESMEKIREYRYAKGNVPAKLLPVGSISIYNGMFRIKTKEGWRFVHREVWEKTHGRKIGKGECVIFLDGNCNNVSPDNLQLVSRKELVYRNKTKAPDSVRRLQSAINKLDKTIKDNDRQDQCRQNALSDIRDHRGSEEHQRSGGFGL